MGIVRTVLRRLASVFVARDPARHRRATRIIDRAHWGEG